MLNPLKIKPKYLLIIVLFFSIVRFHPSFFPEVLAVYWFDLVLIAIVCVWFFYVNETINHGIKEVYIAIFILLPFLLIPVLFVDYLVGYTINLFKILLYILYTFFFLSLISRSNITVPNYIKVLDIAFLFVFVIGVIQLLIPPFLGELIHLFFGDEKLRSIWQGYPRIYSTFYNANWFAVYLVFMLTIWLNYYLFYKKKLSWIFIRIFPLFILLFFSGSRSGFIICGVVFILSLLTYKLSVIKLIKYTVLVSIVGVIIIAIMDSIISTMGLDRFISRLDVFMLALSGDLTGDHALMGRFESQSRAIEIISEKPLFGYGDRPGNFVPHNSLLTILLSFGLIGSFAIVSFVTLITIRIILIKSKNTSVLYLKRCYLLFTVGLFIAMMAADFIYTSQVIFLWIVCLCFVLVFSHKNQINRNMLITPYKS